MHLDPLVQWGIFLVCFGLFIGKADGFRLNLKIGFFIILVCTAPDPIKMIVYFGFRTVTKPGGNDHADNCDGSSGFIHMIPHPSIH